MFEPSPPWRPLAHQAPPWMQYRAVEVMVKFKPRFQASPNPRLIQHIIWGRTSAAYPQLLLHDFGSVHAMAVEFRADLGHSGLAVSGRVDSHAERLSKIKLHCHSRWFGTLGVSGASLRVPVSVNTSRETRCDVTWCLDGEGRRSRVGNGRGIKGVFGWHADVGRLDCIKGLFQHGHGLHRLSIDTDNLPPNFDT